VVEKLDRLFGEVELLWAQRYLLSRLLRPRWRWFAILAPPPGKTPAGVVEWRERLARGSAAEDGDIGGLYWPWLLAQDSPGAPVELRSPVGAVAGIFAQVDVEIGPHAAPANRRLLGVVGLEAEVGDEDNALAYDAGVNVLRAFPGAGIQLWGARTLRWRDRGSRFEPLAFVNARRCLSAIARSVEVIGGPLVFQPNNAMLRIKLHQMVTDYLLRVYRSGALMGEIAEEGFFVKVQTVPESAENELVCEVGVALAAPAEFIVFRLGREGGVIELEEAA
jgi:phage tail sheath protein FI